MSITLDRSIGSVICMGGFTKLSTFGGCSSQATILLYQLATGGPKSVYFCVSSKISFLETLDYCLRHLVKRSKEERVAKHRELQSHKAAEHHIVCTEVVQTVL